MDMIAVVNATERWYALVAASPDPEAQERINVALVTNDRGRQRMVYEDGLRRLRCILPPNQVQVYAAVLKSLASTVVAGVPLEHLNTMLGPQLVLSKPRAVHRPLSRDVVDMLVKKHFTGPETGREHAAAADTGRTYLGELNRVLNRTIESALPGPSFGVEISGQVRFNRLYPHVKRPGGRIPELNRVIRGPRHDLLIGAVLLNGGEPATVRSTGARIGQAFWQYKRLRGAVRSTTGRDLRTIGILVEKEPEPPSRELGLYLRHLWGRDADGVAKLQPYDTPPQKVRDAVEWATRE